MNQFFPFLIYSLIVIAFFLSLTIFADFVKNRIIFRKCERDRKLPYESGVPFRGTTKVRVDIRFFKVALLFLLFDVESVYLFPWAYKLEKLGIFALVEGLIFIFILLFAYFYIIKERGIEWK